RALLETMPPVSGGGDMIERVTFDETTYQKPPLRFEAGTPMIASVIALKAALEFLQEIDHSRSLFAYAEEALSSIPGLRILGTAKEKGPICTFTLEGVHPLDAATLLD